MVSKPKPSTTKSVSAAKSSAGKKPAAAAKPAAPAAVAKAADAPKAKPVAPAKPAVAMKAPKTAPAPAPAKVQESAFTGLMLEATSAPLESMQEMVRQFAETGLGQSRSMFDGFRDAADSATVSFEESTAATRDAAARMNDVIAKTMLSGTTAMFDSMKALSEAESVPDMVAIWNKESQKQFETLTRNSQEFSAAWQSCAEEASKPFLSAYTHGFSS